MFARIFLRTAALLCCLGSLLFSGELVVVIMVKNEGPVIEATLQPYIDGGVKRFLIEDTGSTDDTIEKARALFAKHNLKQAYVVEKPFVDFATSRNDAIDFAEAYFKDDCFFFMPDAEWYMQNVPGLIKFCHDHAHDKTQAFLVLLRNDDTNFQFHSQRLFRAHCGLRFVGVVHEVLNCCSCEKVPDSSYVLWKPSAKGQEKSKQRWSRDRDLLLKDALENPENPRTAFYLAQTYDCLGDLENARLWYTKRCELLGWDEENFMARYRLACVYERMDDWKNALHYHLEAFNLRPSRIESLVHIASYYLRKQQIPLAFIFALAACQVPYPATDTLFIEKELYDYSRFDLLGIAAWYLGKFQMGKDAVKKALAIHPEHKHLHQNLALYNTKV